MEDDYYEEMERCVSDPQGDHTWRALHGGVSAPPENRRCHSLSQLKLLEGVVYEMEDRCALRGVKILGILALVAYAACVSVLRRAGRFALLACVGLPTPLFVRTSSTQIGF
jgi:hypothetical protein